MSELIEKLMKKEIDNINEHLPNRSLPLRDVLLMEVPAYVTRSGERSVFIKAEVERIAREVPEIYHDGIYLPIVILRRIDLGPGVYTISGSKVVLFLIHRILRYDDLTWSDFPNWKPVDQIARPQVQLVRRCLPSTTCIGFVTGLQM